MLNNIDENNNFRLHRFEKNKYFYGKLMTVQDFEAEQSYFDGKNQLINRLLHGSGLVCGFENLEIYKGDKITINFIDGGMALDCCGREIVVPAGTLGIPIVDSEGKPVPDLTTIPYLYLRYKPCYDGYVGAASKSSSCEEKCCPIRIVEDFEVIASKVKPNPNSITCRPELTRESNETIKTIIGKWLDELEKAHISCPSCEKTLEYEIFLGKVEAGGDEFKVNTWDTEKYRIIFTQKELYQLLKCHILDFKNPHNVTAEQIGALKSVNWVSNPGGNVDLVPENSIYITPHENSQSITIGENHSANKKNPHKVTAEQTGALVSVNGVTKPGGNIELIAGSNITITPKPADFTIEIASMGGEVSPGENVKSVGTSLIAGASENYSREDHVHDLEKGVVDFEKLSETLQRQLNLLFMYLRERALKCTVSNFKAAATRLDSGVAFKISQVTREAVDNRIYEKEEEFISSMEELRRLMVEFADEIKGRVPQEIFNLFMRSLQELTEVIGSGDALRVAIQQDEVCFYTSELEIRE